VRVEEPRGGSRRQLEADMEGMQAYGAGKAGGAFDPVSFFQQPQTGLRIVSWVSEAEGMHSYTCRYLSTYIWR